MPAVTPSNVVSHPAYKRYDNSDIDRMRLIVDVYDRFQRVNERVREFELSERVRSLVERFDHYKECVWADPFCKSGQDTCVCDSVAGGSYMIIQSLSKFKEYEDCATAAETNDKERAC